MLAGKVGSLLYPCRFANIFLTFGPIAFSECLIELKLHLKISVPPIAGQLLPINLKKN
jgi:hypothetical protein